ncbi:MAG TPA: hypothetical protein VF798_07575 [Burkholderiaceae bacterium]
MQARALALGRQSLAAPQRKEGVMSAMLRIALAWLPWSVATKAGHADVAAGQVRHVWAKDLVLRAAPDARSRALTDLPRGTTVVLAIDAETPVAHRATAVRHGICVTLDGHWREVVALGRRGWVFDGCLSRYPAPEACHPEELTYAARVFGVPGHASEGVRRRWKLAEHAGAAEIFWTRVAFDTSGKRMAMDGQGATENLATEGMPLTFNEAVLWWLYFHRADNVQGPQVMPDAAR